MALTFGRVGRDMVLREPRSWAQQGDKVTLDAAYGELSASDMLAQRAQLLGYPSPDEPQIIVTSTEVPSLNGFYTVDSLQVSGDGFGYGLPLVPWQAQLTRIDVAPLLESYLIGGMIPNGGGYNNAQTTINVPAATAQLSDYPIGTGLSTATAGVTVNTADGPLTRRYGNSLTAVINTIVGWAVPYTDFYVGETKLEYDTTGSGAWRQIVGRHLPSSNVDRVRLSNGLVRVTFGASTGVITVENRNRAGSSWFTGKSYSLRNNSLAYNVTTFPQVSVLRNSVEEVAIRLLLGPTGVATAPRNLAMLDVSIKRGLRIMFGRIAALTPAASGTFLPQYKIQRTTGEAGTVIGADGRYGVKASAADADNNKYIYFADYVSTPQASAEYTVGAMTFAQRMEVNFGISMILEGLTDPNLDGETELYQLWSSGSSESMRAVSQ